MKPAAFDYHAPSSIGAALELLGQYGYEAKALAGGQSLIPAMNFRLAQPAVLVDLNAIGELFYLRAAADGGLLVGAMTRQAQVEHDPLVATRAPLLHEAMPSIAHSQIRNRGTLGGSLAHADPAAELPAVMVALDARFRIRSTRGERWVPAASFYLGLFTTDLQPDELLVEVAVPPMPPHSGWAFREMARRLGDYALAGAAAFVQLDDAQVVRQARLVFLSVGEGPVSARQAVGVLLGRQPVDEALREAAAVAAQQDVDPTNDIHASAAYRRHLVQVLGEDVLRRAVARAHGAQGDA